MAVWYFARLSFPFLYNGIFDTPFVYEYHRSALLSHALATRLNFSHTLASARLLFSPLHSPHALACTLALLSRLSLASSHASLATHPAHPQPISSSLSHTQLSHPHRSPLATQRRHSRPLQHVLLSPRHVAFLRPSHLQPHAPPLTTPPLTPSRVALSPHTLLRLISHRSPPSHPSLPSHSSPPLSAHLSPPGSFVAPRLPPPPLPAHSLSHSLTPPALAHAAPPTPEHSHLTLDLFTALSRSRRSLASSLVVSLALARSSCSASLRPPRSPRLRSLAPACPTPSRALALSLSSPLPSLSSLTSPRRLLFSASLSPPSLPRLPTPALRTPHPVHPLTHLSPTITHTASQTPSLLLRPGPPPLLSPLSLLIARLPRTFATLLPPPVRPHNSAQPPLPSHPTQPSNLLSLSSSFSTPTPPHRSAPPSPSSPQADTLHLRFALLLVLSLLSRQANMRAQKGHALLSGFGSTFKCSPPLLLMSGGMAARPSTPHHPMLHSCPRTLSTPRRRTTDVIAPLP
ncbi:unnamed protein product, partial [Pleuronectes platessa]